MPKRRFAPALSTAAVAVEPHTSHHLYFLIILCLFGIVLYRLFFFPAPPQSMPPTGTTMQPNIIVGRASPDPITDFYHPPVKKSHWLEDVLYVKHRLMGARATPVNIHTRGIQDEYQQVGILTGMDLAGVPTISPLMGRRSPAGNTQWQYYTIFNGSGSMIPVKLPVTSSGKACSSERGCAELQTGDIVAADGYGTNFQVTVYENQLPYYI
jgi:hypothetical protein